jgi:hypothetical protein
LLLLLAFVLLWPFADSIEGRLGAFAYPLCAIGLFTGLFVIYFGVGVARHLAGMIRMRNPRHALKAARTSAREVGKETKLGLTSIYVFGPNDPTTMLKEQMEICRSRFEWLVEERPDPERPLRVFAFGERAAFDRFFQWAFLFRSNLDGMYVPWSMPTIVTATEFPG